ncbi:MAG TPA: tetratricopeptide repeat protein [Vicinamibacterales bacterium]|nr:tetratricopeptide repeat protein [Vicinamibacterales bacterium]
MADNPRIEELRRRVARDPASIAFATLAEEYRRAGLYWEAIEACRAGLQRHPAYLSARVTLGRSLLAVGEYDEARQQLEQVVRAAPENLAAIRALAEIHERVGEGHDAPIGPAPDETRSATPPPSPLPLASVAPAAPPTPNAQLPTPNVPGALAPAAQASAPKAPASFPTPNAQLPTPALQSALAPPPPAVPEAPPDPALAGLEEFLRAIVRMRASLDTSLSR